MWIKDIKIISIVEKKLAAEIFIVYNAKQ